MKIKNYILLLLLAFCCSNLKCEANKKVKYLCVVEEEKEESTEIPKKNTLTNLKRIFIGICGVAVLSSTYYAYFKQTEKENKAFLKKIKLIVKKIEDLEKNTLEYDQKFCQNPQSRNSTDYPAFLTKQNLYKQSLELNRDTIIAELKDLNFDNLKTKYKP